MSCFSCGRSGLGAPVIKQIQGHLKEIQALFPGTDNIFLLDLNTKKTLVSISETTPLKIVDTLVNIRTSWQELGEALSEKTKNPNSVHIQKDKSLFSYYSLTEDRYILAFFTEAQTFTPQQLKDNDVRVFEIKSTLSSVIAQHLG